MAMIPSMIFFPEKIFLGTPQNYGFSWEEVNVNTQDDVQLHGWFLKAKEEKGVILHFHGNAGNISYRLFKARGWIERGFSVLLIDYRGYGKSSGKILKQEDLIADARAALNWLVNIKTYPLSKIVFYGESLGSYPALQLGAMCQPGAVVLEAPFTSFRKLAAKHYFFIPGFIINIALNRFKLSNESLIHNLQAPLFIIHGVRDEIAPYAMGMELFEKAPNPKEIFAVSDGTHNGLPYEAGEDYWERPYQFLKKHMKI